LVSLPQKTLNWLLENDNPPVRNLTRKYLLNIRPTDADLVQVNDYSPIKSILSKMKPNGSWSDPKNPYQKYKGSYWQYIFLCDLNANPLSKLIKKASEQILSYQLPFGGFSHETRRKFSIICLTANLIRSLIYFGCKEVDNVQKGINFVTRKIIANQGIPCGSMNLLPNCQMALTKVLAMYSYLDKKNLPIDRQKAIKTILNQITLNKIFRYVPSGAKEYHRKIRGKKISQIRQIKAQLIQHPEKLERTEIKNSWKKFGFPNSYTSDALETLYWLAMIDTQDCSEFEEAINCVINRMSNSGYWINENNFRNPMLIDIEPKKAPSKWLTFRACYVLKKFRELEFVE
jgi:hypothetical protein